MFTDLHRLSPGPAAIVSKTSIDNLLQLLSSSQTFCTLAGLMGCWQLVARVCMLLQHNGKACIYVQAGVYVPPYGRRSYLAFCGFNKADG